MGPQWPVNSPTKTLWPTDFDLGKMFKAANSQDLKRQRLADRTNLTDDLDSYRVWPVDSQNG